jgi:hypothetical protein
LRAGAAPTGDGISYDVEAVAPVAAWLAHERCTANGQFFATGAGQTGEVFTSAGHGYQCPQPGSFSLEQIAANWSDVASTDGAYSPASGADYHRFRTAIYDEVVRSHAGGER